GRLRGSPLHGVAFLRGISTPSLPARDGQRRPPFFNIERDIPLGREQAGRRPALIISPAAFTFNTGFAMVCPIASRVRPFPTSVMLPKGLPVAGEILLSHAASTHEPARRGMPAPPRLPTRRAKSGSS
ncbi:MAG: type II toxin-antitoxin system PemK/MazF family toxin, partial [Caulobacteraceae bacterium]